MILNAELYQKAHPDDARGFFYLGRLLYLAFKYRRSMVLGFGDVDPRPITNPKLPGYGDEKPGPIPLYMEEDEDQRPPPPSEPLTPAQIREHAIASAQAFETAILMAPENGEIRLSQAALLELVRPWQAKEKIANLPAVISPITIQRLRRNYAEAFQVSIAEDLKETELPFGGVEAFVSWQAGTALIRLSTQAKLTAEERSQLEEAQKAVEYLTKLPRSSGIP